METVGGYLKKERESKNISLGELSQLTKISELYLTYIEKDEFEKLPPGPYAKGYIASYSRMIGGNVDEAITLYNAIHRKRTQSEEVQPDISPHNGKNGPTEKPKKKARKKPNGSWLDRAKSLFNTALSSLPNSPFSFKAVGTSIQKIGSAVRINRNWLDSVVSFSKKIAFSRSWRYALIALFGIGILVLAGFGFYHLFIYDPDPLSVSRLQDAQEKDPRPLPAIGSEKPVLPSGSSEASPVADQLEKDANNKRYAEPANLTEAKKQATASSTEPDAAIPSTKIVPARTSGPSTAVPQTHPPLSDSSSTTENADYGRPTSSTESQVRSDQTELTAAPSPQPTTADAELNVLQATVCADIKNRMPVGVDTSFPTSAQRVFVWSEIEAKQIPSKIRHIYYFNGQKISDVVLDVRSANWRTWSLKNISDHRFRGEWRVDITTAGGKVLRRLYFAVE